MQTPNLVEISNKEQSTNMVNVIHNRDNFSRQAFSNDAAQIKDHTELCKLCELNVSFVYEGSVQSHCNAWIYSKQKMTSVGG